jgi:hypothetical protein
LEKDVETQTVNMILGDQCLEDSGAALMVNTKGNMTQESEDNKENKEIQAPAVRKRNLKWGPIIPERRSKRNL